MEDPSGKPKSSPQRPKHNRLKASAALKRERPRLNVSRETLDRCRALRAVNGFLSDDDLVLHLLRAQKKLQSSSSSSGASDRKVTFSRSKMRSLIKKEVWSTLENNETKLRAFVESIQALDTAAGCGKSVKKLEARVDMLTQRAAKALVLMTQQKRLPSVSHRNVIRSDSEEEGPAAQAEKKDWSSQLTSIMETTKEALKKMNTDHQAFRETMAELREMCSGGSAVSETESGDLNEAKGVKVESTSPGVSDALRRAHSQNDERVAARTANAKESKQSVEPQANKLKLESPSKSTAVKEFTLLCLGLPTLRYSPSSIPADAAMYSLPQRLEVCMALIKRPSCLSVVWKVSEKDPTAPPMDSYSVFLTMERVKGSDRFQEWMNLGELTAIPLPICVMINNYKPGHKVAVTVVGKDKFGRYGPFSKIRTAIIPE